MTLYVKRTPGGLFQEANLIIKDAEELSVLQYALQNYYGEVNKAIENTKHRDEIDHNFYLRSRNKLDRLYDAVQMKNHKNT